MKQFFNVPILMRDGVRLSADICRPDGDGPFPVIVHRTPYNAAFSGFRDVEAGYAVVLQDCRGRHDSEGCFAPFREAEDGFDTLAWVRAQKWCDGRLGMIGGSYTASTQLAAAWMNPPGLRAITPRVMGRDLFKDLIYHNGVFNLSLCTTWGFGVSGRVAQSGATVDWPRIFRHLPLITMDEAAGYHVPYFREWLSHPTYDGYWADLSVEAHYPRFDLPILHMGGWYDLYLDGLLRNYQGIRNHGGPMARAHQKLIVGPWGHALNTRSIGQLDFGPQAVTNLDDVEARWLERWVSEKENGIEHEPPVRIFVMGTNVWRDESEWPLARAEERALHLVSGGRANSLHGDGVLSTDAPQGAETDTYVYNPDNPVPTLGGCVIGAPTGPQDHAPIERRDDVLVFTGPELREPLEVTGFVKAVLYAASDAVDTDFIARLCDVYPDGRSMILCDGVVRTRFREGLDREVLMQPGRIYELEIEMGATSNTFLPGHRVRLEITSSCFPRFSRNLNTGEPIATGTRLRPARQTIHHSRSHPSRLILPVAPNERSSSGA
jgi:hypothetical protein